MTKPIDSDTPCMTIGTWDLVRITRQTSVPGMPGSMRSSSTRSAPPLSKAATAAGPSSATVVWSPSRCGM